jgi:ATP-dependent Zn protease
MHNRLNPCARFLPAGLVLAACGLLAGAPVAGAVKASSEPYSALQTQIKDRKVQKATVSPQKDIVKVKTSDGKTYKVTYPASQQTTLVSSLKASGAKVHVDKKKKSSSHFRIRYVILIVLAVAVIAGAAYWLLRGRRRGGPGTPVTISPGPANPPS